MRLQELLEGRNDPHIFKAVFVLGGPGSGKTYLSRKIAGGSGLRPVNLDDFYERFLNKIASKGYDAELYKHSGQLMQKQLDMYVDGRLGLLIDGTGRNIRRLSHMKKKLEELGYDTLGIYVNTDINTALDRNERRARRVDPDFLKQVHSDLKSKIGDLQRLFQNNLLVIDNKTDDKTDLSYYSKQLSHFLNTPPGRQAAKKWLFAV